MKRENKLHADLYSLFLMCVLAALIVGAFAYVYSGLRGDSPSVRRLDTFTEQAKVFGVTVEVKYARRRLTRTSGTPITRSGGNQRIALNFGRHTVVLVQTNDGAHIDVDGRPFGNVVAGDQVSISGPFVFVNGRRRNEAKPPSDSAGADLK